MTQSTYRQYKDFAICNDGGGRYSVVDALGFWRGTEQTPAMARDLIEDILERQAMRAQMDALGVT